MAQSNQLYTHPMHPEVTSDKVTLVEGFGMAVLALVLIFFAQLALYSPCLYNATILM